MVAAVANRRVTAFEIAEGVLALAAGQPDRVDETQCIIYGVKVAGFESRNLGRTIGLFENEFGDAANRPYSYSRIAFERALPMYEDCRVIVRHPKFEYDDQTGQRFVTDDRDDEDCLVGWLRNVRVTESGVYADLHYLGSHPFSARLVEIAKRNPGKLALSHEAMFADPRVVSGRIVLNEITHVDCVAIVAGRPGTTNSLFESAATKGTAIMKLKVRQCVEGLPAAHRRRRLLLEMLGDGGAMAPMADAETDAAAGASPEDAVKAAFRAIINKVLDEATSADDAAKKIKELLDAQEQAAAAVTGATGGGSGSGSGSGSASGSGGGDGKPAAESAAAGAGQGSGQGAASAAASASGSGGAATAAAAAAGAVTESAGGKIDPAALLESAELLTAAKRQAPAIVLEAMARLPDKAARERYVAALEPIAAQAQGGVTGGVDASGNPVVPRSAPAPAKTGSAAESAAAGGGNGNPADKYAAHGSLAEAFGK